MKCKVEQDEHEHSKKLDEDEAKSEHIDEMADHIIHTDLFDEIFIEEKVFIAATKYIQGVMIRRDIDEIIHDWRNLESEIKKKALAMSEKMIEKEGK